MSTYEHIRENEQGVDVPECAAAENAAAEVAAGTGAAAAEAADAAGDAAPEVVAATGVAEAAAAEAVAGTDAAGAVAAEAADAAGDAAELTGFSQVTTEPLFEEEVDFDTFSKSDFRAVKVKACEAVPKSKKLLQFTLDDGTGEDRVILSGIHKYYEPEELVGKTLIAITNLPPRKMMGIYSCGMLLSAIHSENGEERLNLLMVSDAIPAGAKLY